MKAYHFGRLRFEPGEGRLTHVGSGQSVTLRPQVGRLLQAFVEQPETLIAREALVQAVWDEKAVVDFESGLAVILKALRSEIEALGESSGLIETLPRRGYRLRAQVRSSGRPRSFWQRLVVGALVVLAILALGYWLLGQTDPKQSLSRTDPEEKTLAVVPFEQFGDATSQSLAILLADRLLMALWARRPDDIVLVGRAWSGSVQLQGDDRKAVAGQLAVDLLIEGTVTVDGEQISVTARLLEMPESTIVWAEALTADNGSLPGALDRIAADLAASLVSEWNG